MPHKQSHQQYPCRIAVYVTEAMKAWVAAQAGAQGISESQFVAKILEQQIKLS